MKKTIAMGAIAALAGGVLVLAGCRHPNDNVQLDSSKTVKPMTEERKTEIINNPNIPPGLKGMMLGKPGGPPQLKGAGGAPGGPPGPGK